MTSTRKTLGPLRAIIDQQGARAGYENPLEWSSVPPERQFPLDRLTVGQCSRDLFEVGGQRRRNL